MYHIEIYLFITIFSDYSKIIDLFEIMIIFYSSLIRILENLIL